MAHNPWISDPLNQIEKIVIPHVRKAAEPTLRAVNDLRCCKEYDGRKGFHVYKLRRQQTLCGLRVDSMEESDIWLMELLEGDPLCGSCRKALSAKLNRPT